MTVEVEVLGLFISPGHDFKGHHGRPRDHHAVLREEAVECVAGKGLVGDRYFGFRDDFKGQVTFFDAAVLEALRDEHGAAGLDPAGLRRNVLLRGVDLNALIGRTFSIGDARFAGSEECAPCYWMDGVAGPGAEAFLRGRGGLRARVLEGGTLRLGPSRLRFE